MSRTIAIAGLGWLGKPLLDRLQLLGYQVKASVTSDEKVRTLKHSGIDAFRLEISEAGVSGAVSDFLADVDSLVIMIPPGLRRNTGANYVMKMTHLLNEINKASVNKVILVSSTSVYDDAQQKVTENTIPKPSTLAGKQLLEVEQLFFSAKDLTTSIVRFGGLFGGNRQPTRYLAGRKDLRNGNSPVNLIHRDDCIGILTEIISQNAYGHCFNGVAPQHPTKESYYTKRAKELGMTPPTFSETNKSDTYKQVDSERIDLILGYDFIHPLQ